MTLIGSILRKVKSQESMKNGYGSPPPEFEDKKKKKPTFKYDHITAKVDTSPPRLDPRRPFYKFEHWARSHKQLVADNKVLFLNIKRMHFSRGKVDCSWKPREMPLPNRLYFETRLNFYKHVHRENKILYKRLKSAIPRIDTTEELNKDWNRNRKDILLRAQMKFVLFPPIPQDDMEDIHFKAPPGVKRVRAYLTLAVKGGAQIGVLQVELFTEICPDTCKLFLELLCGDGVGFSYVGTEFFRKVPTLYWSGGDVVYNSGFGCYAQRGRMVPIGAENYHFSHSMPGLLSMRVTPDNETCGTFNITFKPLPQFDIKNVVFGRVIRPSEIYNCIVDLGSALNKRPIVVIHSTRVKVDGRWVCGAPNTQLVQLPASRVRRSFR